MSATTTRERVSNRDRRWFATHPDATERLRPVVAGECGALPTDDCTHMLVVQMAPGARTRIGLHIFREDDGPVKLLVHAPTGDRWEIATDGAVQRSATGREAWEVVAGADVYRLITLGRRMAVQP